MHRLFDPHPTRWRRSLDGAWAFRPTEDGIADDPSVPADFPERADRIDVPAAWNVIPEYHRHEGIAWYHRSIEVPRNGWHRLAFLGVCHEAAVWVDGTRVADHYGGYTPFDTYLELEAGAHDLIVRVDNTRDARSIPKPGSDWYPYGGITREVLVESVPPQHIRDIQIDYELAGVEAAVTVTCSCHNHGAKTDGTLTVEIADTTAETSVELPSGASTAVVELSLTPDRWTLADPNLYTTSARLDTATSTDTARDRAGFRTIEVTETDILLNGSSVDIRGVNRHEDHPEWGHAQPLRVQALDLDVIEAAGLNTIRTAHYPVHPRLLDLCDQRGILVLEEIPFWQFDTERFERQDVLARGKAMLREMIERDRHHPAIIAWSLTNECRNEEPGVAAATEELAVVAHELDDRPLTLATNRYKPDRPGEDLAVEHVDLICANGYPGWYTDGSYAAMLARMREDYPETPIVFSEFGAGAVYGERTREGVSQKWSEPFQAELIDDAIDTFERTAYVAGFTIWQFCDTRTDPRNWSTRPKTKNNKGILDEYRRPKDAYNRVAQRFGE